MSNSQIHTWWRHASIALMIAATHTALAADTYPDHPVRLIVPFAAGGGTDGAARIVASALGDKLGRPFIVENRPGSAGTLGTALVAKSKPDGYTLCFCTTGPLAVIPQHDSALPYDPFEDLAAVSHVLTVENVIMARNDLAADDLPQLIALARRSPGMISFATPGAGGTQHLAGEWLQIEAGISMIHIPYRGDSPALADLLGGHVDLLIGSASVARELLAQHKIKVLANLGATRSKHLPDVKTGAESGFPDLSYVNFVGINAPARTPAHTIDTLSTAVAEVIADPAIQRRLEQAGYVPVGSSAHEYQETMKHEALKWAKVLKTVHISRE